MKTIRDFLDESTTRGPGCPAQKFFQQEAWITRSYAALHERVVRAAAIVQHLGIEPGRQQVALMLENGPEWQEIYLALAGSGVAVVPLDPKLRPQEALHILRDSDAVALFAGARLAPVLDAIVAQLPQLRACVWIGAGTELAREMKAGASHGYERLMEQAGGALDAAREWFDRHRPAPGTIASILYTSGTTGKPKGAMLTHGNFTSNVEASIRQVGFHPSDNFLNILPLFHSFSFTANFMLPLSLGGCCSFVRSIKTITEDMRLLQPTVMLAVPLLAEKIYARIQEQMKKSMAARVLRAAGLGALVHRRIRARFGGRLRLIGIGGAPTDPATLRGFQRIGIPVLEGYGLTECSPGVAYPSLASYVVGTVGQVLDNLEYKLLEPDATGAGELCVRGPSVMLGYYKNPGATAEVIDADGYLHTGDLARLDDRKNLTICGRRKALIVNREGKNIYPEEIEQVIERCPFVKDVIVLGYQAAGETGERVGAILVPDEEALATRHDEPVAARWGEAVAARWHAAVAARRGGGAAAPEPSPGPAWARGQREAFVRDEVARLCREQLADYKQPRKIEIRAEPLERTSTLKVRRVVYAGALDEQSRPDRP